MSQEFGVLSVQPVDLSAELCSTALNNCVFVYFIVFVRIILSFRRHVWTLRTLEG